MTPPPEQEAGLDPLYAGLRALMATTFPKRCANCGRSYANEAEFVAQTNAVPTGRSGFKQSRDDDGETIVELFRNCVCGSTLMDCFTDRRDHSASGQQRRAKFDELIGVLAQRGLDRETARGELLKLLRGQTSALLQPSKTHP